MGTYSNIARWREQRCSHSGSIVILQLMVPHGCIGGEWGDDACLRADGRGGLRISRPSGCRIPSCIVARWNCETSCGARALLSHCGKCLRNGQKTAALDLLRHSDNIRWFVARLRACRQVSYLLCFQPLGEKVHSMIWPDTAILVHCEARSSNLARSRHLIISVVRSCNLLLHGASLYSICLAARLTPTCDTAQ